MDEYIIKEETLTDIADAIRAKRNITQELTPQEMSAEIMKITTGEGGGENGATFIPSVDSEGNLSWSNDKGLANPTPVNIKGDTGPQGVQGIPGNNGYTPQRGVDYWTEEDKQEILNEVGDNVGYTPISNQEIDEICTYEGIFSVDGVEF